MSEPTAGAGPVRDQLGEGETGRKGEILDAAFSVFAEQGYDAGSMRDIASQVGVSEPALYRHFPSKEALFLALMRVGAGRMRNETLALVDSIRAETLREQLLGVLTDRRRAMRFYGPLLRAILPAAAKNERFLQEYRAVVIEPAFAALTEKATEIDEALGVPDAALTRPARVRALMALMVGYMMSSFVLGDDPDEAIVDAAIRVMNWEPPG